MTSFLFNSIVYLLLTVNDNNYTKKQFLEIILKVVSCIANINTTSVIFTSSEQNEIG